MPRTPLALLPLAIAFAAILHTPAAHAREDQDLNSQLMAMSKWSNQPWHMAAYEKILADPTLTDVQRARVISFRANARYGAGDKVGQLADLDLLVEQYPGVPNAARYREDRAYAYGQAWHMASRVLAELDKVGGLGGGELRDLWDLGYWDDVAAFALKNGAITIGETEAARSIAGKLAASGRGTPQMCVAITQNRQPCEIGPNDPSPQPLQGEGLAAALKALQMRAAANKAD